jgi:hypothetical protein
MLLNLLNAGFEANFSAKIREKIELIHDILKSAL